MNWKTTLFLTLFAGLLIFLTFNRHKHNKNGYFNYQSEIWADKAGYNVYLPATFIYKFDASAFPDSIDSRTGDGFKLDKKTKIVHTKYTYGVALMQAPFFLAAYLYSSFIGMESTGYEPIYHAIINLSAVFYLVLGLFFLFKFLSYQYSWRTAFLSVAIIFLGTNLYYYAIDDTGMSHVYSFFLFSAFLLISRGTEFLKSLKLINLIIISVISSIILLIRPTGAMFILVFFFLDLNQRSYILQRFSRVWNIRAISIFLVVFVLIWLPQLLYWKYSTGDFFSYSYGGEGFNFLSPKLLYTWFSPINGLFLYTPIYFVIILGILGMIKKKVTNGWLILLLFFTISFVFSSWWDWSFGCSFGARSFVEYLSLFAMPIAYILSQYSNLRLYKKVLIVTLVMGFVIFNLKVTYTYDSCFFGTEVWDWSEFLSLVTSPTK